MDDMNVKIHLEERGKMAKNMGSESRSYFVDGNRDYTATTLVFVNDALTDFRIWDPLVQELHDRYPDWRFVRYGKFLLEPSPS